MADIVNFRSAPSKRHAPEQTSQRRAQSAEIVIFPGVRYQRWEEQPDNAVQPDLAAKPAAPRKSRKKRDTLELVDA